MKKLVFLRQNVNAIGGAEIYLKRLQKALELMSVSSEIRSFKGSNSLSSWIKALKFNAQVKRQKRENELYFSLERVGSADIYRAGDGVHKVYMKSKIFWFLNPLNFVYPYLEKRCFQNSKLIITNSNFIKNQIIQTYNIDENKIKTIYNGINLPKKVEKGRAKFEVCKEFGIDLLTPIVLFVGSGFKRKGLREFLQILSKVDEKFNVIIVGKDKKMQAYKKMAKKLSINAIFTGTQKNVAKFYEASDIFLFPTKYEPFSNVVLEAMSFKNAVITTATNGASEILDSEFVMRDCLDFEISNLIQNLLKDSQKLFEIQEKNYEISKNFSIENNANLTLEAINAYLN